MKKVPDTLKNFWNKKEKVRRRNAKQTGETATKVSPAFSKAARSRTRGTVRNFLKKVPDTLKNFWNKREKARRRDAKRNGETAIKVFAPLFSKSGTFPRSLYRRFFLLSFFFAPLAPKKKRRECL